MKFLALIAALIAKYVFPVLLAGFLLWFYWPRFSLWLEKKQKARKTTITKAVELAQENKQPLKKTKKAK